MTQILSRPDAITDELIDQLLSIFSQMNQQNIWSQVQKGHFTVQRFSQGMDSNVVLCQLTCTAKEILHGNAALDPSAVVVKLRKSDPQEWQTLSDCIVINTLLSEAEISPKLLFINGECYIHKFISGRTYTFEDDENPEMVRQLARILAKVHSLSPPISKHTWLAEEKNKDDFLQKRDQIYGWGDLQANGQKYLKILEEYPKLKEEYYAELVEIDYHREWKYVYQLIDHLQSPLVFSHWDLNRDNRLIRESEGSFKRRIYLIDWDTAHFNRRGGDLGDYFANYRHKDDFTDEGFPTDEEMGLFLNEYRHTSGDIQGDSWLLDEANSLEQLISESKIFTLASLICGAFFGLMWFQEGHQTDKGEYFLNVAKNQNRAYNKLKAQFIADGTIPNILEK